MQTSQPLALLGGLSPDRFMHRHWQKKPLLVRQAWPGLVPPLSRPALFALSARQEVESRLVERDPRAGWRLRHGPFARRALPPLARPDWTLLVQGADLHDDGAHALLQAFRFLPDARLDDLMISYASDGGGVGPHFDSYDVFLLQASGRREWAIGRQRDLTLQPGLPLKILDRFVPEQRFVLEPGDMLYLPPRYAHEGVAVGGDCMTYSIGLRAPTDAELGADLLARLADAATDELADTASSRRYGDATQPAVERAGGIPAALQSFARTAARRAVASDAAIDRALGELLTEPKSNVWFDPLEGSDLMRGVRLDRRTRMLYDAHHVYINGESFRASGRDAALMQRLSDRRQLSRQELRRASVEALALLQDWCEAGWAHGQ